MLSQMEKWKDSDKLFEQDICSAMHKFQLPNGTTIVVHSQRGAISSVTRITGKERVSRDDREALALFHDSVQEVTDPHKKQTLLQIYDYSVEAWDKHEAAQKMKSSSVNNYSEELMVDSAESGDFSSVENQAQQNLMQR